MNWKDKTKEELLKHSVSIGLALIAFLSLVVWQAVPSSVWASVSAATPKRVLWALLALAFIALCGLTVLVFYYTRKPKRTSTPVMLEQFGVLWDAYANPHCPVDKTLMNFSSHSVSGGILDEGTDYLYCPKCHEIFTLWDSKLGGTTLDTAREFMYKGCARVNSN